MVNLKIELPYKIKIFFFFLGFIIKILLSSFIVYFYGVYIFNLPYKLLNIKISYVIGAIIGYFLVKYWEKFIKRKLHFLIIGDNKL